MGVERAGVITIAGVFYHHFTFGGEDPAVAGIAGGQDAIHHVDTAGDVLRQFVRHANAHGVTGPVFGQVRLAGLHHFEAERARLPYGEAPDGVAVSIKIHKLPGALRAEVWEDGALHDGEEGVAGGRFGNALAVVGEGAFGPAHGSFHGGAGGFMGDRIRGTFVQHHHDV